MKKKRIEFEKNDGRPVILVGKSWRAGLSKCLRNKLGYNGMENVKISDIRNDWGKCDFCGRHNKEINWYHGPTCGNIVSITAKNVIDCENLGWNICEDCAKKLKGAIECALEKFNETKRETDFFQELKRTAEELGEGFIAVSENSIIMTYQGVPMRDILEQLKCRIEAALFNSYAYAYIIDVRDINTKIWEFNKKEEK